MESKTNSSINFDIGYFDTEEEAALAYDWASRILYGPEAQVNFPDVIVPAVAAFMIRHSAGAPLRVGFNKRNGGGYREFKCRIANPRRPFYLANQNLIVVKTNLLLGYRCIPIEGIKMLEIDGNSYKVVS
ncbi:MAG: hypothetical protein JW749_07225 [Sedimentisphaerales bacterium]|nr:hypothetical protein [Sedimentisphaerales bacterium]